MKYEIINPSDKCYIFADDQRLAIIACSLLGGGMYGLKNESGETVLYPLQDVDYALGMTMQDIGDLAKASRMELSRIFGSFQYESSRTSLNNIGRKAELYCEALSKEAIP